ncbi:MAG: flagellar filament capping protein FliD [Synergistaceae bacterium]|nr:flagellar filament capping protein FliD [Synergistaceae bacterium]
MMADMSITGIASGIDWDSMVTQMLENAKKPAYVILDKRDKLELKKTLWEELRVSMQALQSALSPLKLSSTFKAKQVEIERIDRNTSYKGVLTATVNADAAINVYDLEVLKLAQGQTSRSNNFSADQKLVTNDSYFYVNAGGHKVRVDVSEDDTLQSLADKINTKFKTQVPPVAVTATVVPEGSNHRLVLKSDNTGLGNTPHTASITRSANAYDMLLFNVDSKNADPNLDLAYYLDVELGGINGGALTVKDENGTSYKEGVDFDIVNGNRIRWRNSDPLIPPPGAAYQDKYVAYGGETYTRTATRSAGSDVDQGVLPFTPLSGNSVSITSDGNTYSNTGASPDFQVAPDGSIHWLGVNKPVDGSSYEITYTAVGGEVFTFDITRGNQDVLTSAGVPTYADFAAGTTTIQQAGSRVWREGLDFDIVQGPGGEPVVQWYTGGAGDAPEPDTSYDITLQRADGTSETIAVTRNATDTVSLPHNGTFGPAPGSLIPQGTHTITYNGLTFEVSSPSPPADWDFTPDLDATDPTHHKLTITWKTPTGSPTPHTNTPTYGKTYTVDYTTNTNTFYLSDDGNGTLAVLGFDLMDEEHYTAAQDAELMLDGQKHFSSSNRIGEGYDITLITGMTIDLKGLGRVSLDVSQNAETAVTSLQDFLTAYNDILTWINTRMTEKEVDETKKATLDSDDFRMKWGLLNGNSLLRSTKNSMRRLTSQTYATAFTERASRNTIYGTMLQNGIVNAGSFTVAAGSRVASIPVSPGDTLKDIADRINAPKIDGLDNPLHLVTINSYGKEETTLFAKAAVEGDKLVIRAGTDQQILLGGSAHVLSSLGVNYQYNALSQIGIKLKSDGEMTTQGQTGELNFDTSVFMAALENNAEDVSMLVTNFAGQMQTFVDDMIKATNKEVAAGVAAAQGAVVREMNAIDEEIKSIDKYLTDFERRLLAKQESLYAQFSAAEVSLSQLMQQASWLSSVTAQLQQQSTTQ